MLDFVIGGMSWTNRRDWFWSCFQVPAFVKVVALHTGQSSQLVPAIRRSVTLGNVRLCGATLDSARLPASDGSRLLQLIGELRDTTHELAVVLGTLGA